MAAKWPENEAQGIVGCMSIEIEQDPCKFCVNYIKIVVVMYGLAFVISSAVCHLSVYVVT